MTHSTIRTNSDDHLFTDLVQQLDQELAIINGDQNDFFAQFNKIDLIKHVVVILLEDEPVACGAIKKIDDTTMEVKRMFTLPNFRNNGLATTLLRALESWAKEMGCQFCILETSIRQPDAIALYKKNGYSVTENYGQYLGVKESLCFKKRI
jgi:putative acetyltransferase